MACHFNQKVNNHKITLVPEVYRKNYAVFRNGRSSMVGGGNKSVLIIVDVQKDFLPGGTLACMASDPSFSKKVIDKINTLVEANVFDYYVYTQDAHPPGHISFRSTHGTTAPTVEIELKRKGKTQQLMWEEHCRSDGGHNKGMDLSDALYQDQFKVKGRSVCVTTYPANYYIQPPVLSCNLEEGRTIAEKLADKSFILWKGQNKMVDSYSAFKDADDDDTGLHTFLLARDVKNVYVSGIAREVCVYSTARDATKYYFGADTNITENPSSGNKCFNVYFIWDATVPVPLKKSVFAGFAAEYNGNYALATSADAPKSYETNKPLPNNIKLAEIVDRITKSQDDNQRKEVQQQIADDITKPEIVENLWIEGMLGPYGINVLNTDDVYASLGVAVMPAPMSMPDPMSMPAASVATTMPDDVQPESDVKAPGQLGGSRRMKPTFNLIRTNKASGKAGQINIDPTLLQTIYGLY